MDTQPTPEREPILTLPRTLTVLLAIFAVVHLIRALLPDATAEWLIWTFGFVPARYDVSLLENPFYGGEGAKIWTFLTYALLHADLSHVVFNSLWLLPFGSAVARRFGPVRFFAFMAVTAIAGALAHLLTHEHEVAPMIGASAAVSGAMAASIRFAFGHGGFLSFGRGDANEAARAPALPLIEALRHPRVLAFLGVWFAVNLVFGIGSISVSSQAQSIAWQAHVGGFLAGLLLFSLFDPVPDHTPDGSADTDPS